MWHESWNKNPSRSHHDCRCSGRWVVFFLDSPPNLSVTGVVFGCHPKVGAQNTDTGLSLIVPIGDEALDGVDASKSNGGVVVTEHP